MPTASPCLAHNVGGQPRESALGMPVQQLSSIDGQSVESPYVNDLQSIFARIIREDLELREMAVDGLGPWAYRLWTALVAAGESFLQNAHSIFVSAFMLDEGSAGDADLGLPKEPEHDWAIACVAIHAVLSRIEELITKIAHARAAVEVPDLDALGDSSGLVYSLPEELLGALTKAARDSTSNERLEALVCREASERLGVFPTPLELEIHVSRRVSIFRALGIEAYKIALPETPSGSFR
jgi:hypothetical protein